MRVLHVCAELFPLLKTGGLADVTGALPSAQIAAGADVRLLMPGFPALTEAIETLFVTEQQTFAGKVVLRFGTYQGIGIYLIDAPHLYHRFGSPYHDQNRQAYSDNYLRFALLGWMACQLVYGADYYWQPDIVHAHDWHAGLACAYIAERGRRARTVFTVHNLAYQGLFDMQHFSQIDLQHLLGVEFYGQLSYLKAGLSCSDHVTAVSPTYAQEITLPEYGYGMEGVLQERQRQGCLSGILNGVDYKIWHPYFDKLIAHRYSANHPGNKVKNKLALQSLFGLPQNEAIPLFCVVSRLSDQKGLDLLLDVIPQIINLGAQLVVLGSGDAWLEQAFQSVADDEPQQIAVRIGYDEPLSHKMIAGADVIMLPSRFEPCGLTQLYGLKYGTLPLVRHTGGLADTVIDSSKQNLANGSASGFVFYDANSDDLARAIKRALALWKKPTQWRKIQKHGMELDHSWKTSAKAYINLYNRLIS